jgi:hypothetical protein
VFFGNSFDVASDAARADKQLKTADQFLEEIIYLKWKMLIGLQYHSTLLCSKYRTSHN